LKRTIAFTSALAALTLSTLACTTVVNLGDWPGSGVQGSGDVAEESRAIEPGVTGVELAMHGDLIITLGESEGLVVEAEDNLLPHIRSEIRGDTLWIGTRSNTNLRSTRPIRFSLTLNELDTIQVSSSGNIDAPDLEAERLSLAIRSSGTLTTGDLTCDALSLEISSSGNMRLGTIVADTVDVEIRSSGRIEIDGGAADRQSIRISSSGNYEARHLESRTADVRITSSGSAYVWVEEALDATLTSSGSVLYVGDPEIDASTSSSGDVVRFRD
jgi:hypothetical protein